MARILALADDHEINPLNYFLVFAPVNFLRLNDYEALDKRVNDTLEGVFSNYSKEYDALSYEAKITIRQLMHINSRQWAAKAFSVGESLGIRTIYPYIWRDILTLQGAIPWKAKINSGVVKWPLKRLLEEYMPPEFILDTNEQSFCQNSLTILGLYCYKIRHWGCSSAGRVLDWQSRGRGFNPLQLHQFYQALRPSS